MNALLPRNLLARVFALLMFALPALAQESEEEPEDVPLFSQAELDQMLAPVALYPDDLLSQLLMAATYPLELVQAARWSRANPGLTGQDAVRAVDDQPWDPSVKAMVAFPDILRRMDEDLDWTQRLGDAFLAQQDQVMDTVQALRQRAEDAGNLASDDHVEVVHEERTIILRDRYPNVVYVPWYSPIDVYGTWWWPAYQPVYWDPWPGYYRGNYFYWGPSIVIGHGFYYGYCDWRSRQIRYVDTPPFYYHRRSAGRQVWVHETRHRRGVPYPDQRVHQRYADDRARPPRSDRPDRRARAPDAATQPVVNQGSPGAGSGDQDRSAA